MAGITSVGVGSGLDLEGLITNIVAAERRPAENRLNLNEARATASISALGSLKSSLSDMQAALAKLKGPANFNARSATSTDSTVFTATAGSKADLGTHAIEVLNLAQTHKLASENFTGPTSTVGHGTLTIGVGGDEFTVTIEQGVNDSLTGIRDAINNAEGNTGVRASLLTVSDGAGGTATKLVLTAKESGSAGAITVAAADADAGDGNDLTRLAFTPETPGSMTEASKALDATITIDGFKVVSSTNTFTDALEGVTITALKEGTDSEAPLSGQLIVGENKTGIKSAIEGFVANYNALITVLNELTNYDPATQTRGLLSGDASVNVMESRIRDVLGSPVEGAASDFNTLGFLGISTNRDGSISLDDDKLTKTLETRYDDVAALFAGDKGVAGKMDSVIGELTRAGGVFDTRQETLQKQVRSIEDQRLKLDARIEKIETRYRKQFAALDTLVAQLNQTGDFLTQQLEATAQIVNRNNS